MSDIASRALALVTILTSPLVADLAPRGASALEQTAMRHIGEQVASHSFRLLADLHEPDPRADSMQAATFEKKGWHHHSPQRPVAIPAGATVQVTGVFNYAERGFFLEVTRAAAGGGEEERTRVRFRIMVEAAGSDPQAQEAEAIALIRRVLEPLPEP